MRGWLVNDRLTCIPGTKTFWHNLLNWFPELEVKMTPFKDLVSFIENEARSKGCPDYIIRNATYFGNINITTKMISFLQDGAVSGLRRVQQLDVCNNSDIVVCNSPAVFDMYANDIKSKMVMIPIGTDFNHFRPLDNKKELMKKWGIYENSILFVGAASGIKGFGKILELIENTSYNFCLVMKDGYSIVNNRVKIFNRVDHDDLVEIINCCSMLVCSSIIETLHLAGVEAAACGLPLLTTDVGIYKGWSDDKWGMKVKDENFVEGVGKVFSNIENFNSREYFLEKGLDKETCKIKWKELLL